MKIYRIDWTKINWAAYYAEGYNYTEKTGTVYGTTKEIALKHCPITEKEGKIYITEIEILTE